MKITTGFISLILASSLLPINGTKEVPFNKEVKESYTLNDK